jgi:hypothetical protein
MPSPFSIFLGWAFALFVLVLINDYPIASTVVLVLVLIALIILIIRDVVIYRRERLNQLTDEK